MCPPFLKVIFSPLYFWTYRNIFLLPFWKWYFFLTPCEIDRVSNLKVALILAFFLLTFFSPFCVHFYLFLSIFIWLFLFFNLFPHIFLIFSQGSIYIRYWKIPPPCHLGKKYEKEKRKGGKIQDKKEVRRKKKEKMRKKKIIWEVKGWNKSKIGKN